MSVDAAARVASVSVSRSVCECEYECVCVGGVARFPVCSADLSLLSQTAQDPHRLLALGQVRRRLEPRVRRRAPSRSRPRSLETGNDGGVGKIKSVY